MPIDSRAQLRALALWHSRRRAVDELLAPLLEYGPIAVDRVTDKLDQVRALVQAENEAFEAFVGLAGEPREAKVLDLFARAARDD